MKKIYLSNPVGGRAVINYYWGHIFLLVCLFHPVVEMQIAIEKTK